MRSTMAMGVTINRSLPRTGSLNLESSVQDQTRRMYSTVKTATENTSKAYKNDTIDPDAPDIDLEEIQNNVYVGQSTI